MLEAVDCPVDLGTGECVALNFGEDCLSRRSLWFRSSISSRFPFQLDGDVIVAPRNGYIEILNFNTGLYHVRGKHLVALSPVVYHRLYGLKNDNNTDANLYLFDLNLSLTHICLIDFFQNMRNISLFHHSAVSCSPTKPGVLQVVRFDRDKGE